MLISHKHKFITIDIPKTGTRSLRTTLSPLGVVDIIGAGNNKTFAQHGTAIECERDLANLGYDFNEYFSFCVVRNPWERYLSFFKYYKEQAEEYLNTHDHEGWSEAKIEQCKGCVQLFGKGRTDQKILKIIINNNYCQSDYYLNKTGQKIVSKIAEFAKIQQEFDDFCQTVNIPITKLKHENKSKTSITCKDVYNQELIDLVAKKERHVIDMNQYSI